MKKLSVALLAVALLPVLGFGQGTVNFGTTDLVNHRILSSDLTPVPSGSIAELWYSPDNIAPFTLIGTNVVTVNGWLTTSVLVLTPSSTPPGASAWFHLYAYIPPEVWDGRDGPLNGFSSPFLNPTGNPNATPPGVPATLDGWNHPLVFLPEPSSLTLAGLGFAALLIFRPARSRKLK